MTYDDASENPDFQPRIDQAALRRADALRRVQLAELAAADEARRAQELIDEFIAECQQRGIAPEPLRMKLPGGATARTDKQGWYIKVNGSVAIGSDGNYYILSMPGGLRERLTGVRLTPSQPALQVSRGGRDGETGELADFLTRRLREQARTEQ